MALKIVDDTSAASQKEHQRSHENSENSANNNRKRVGKTQRDKASGAAARRRENQAWRASDDYKKSVLEAGRATSSKGKHGDQVVLPTPSNTKISTPNNKGSKSSKK